MDWLDAILAQLQWLPTWAWLGLCVGATAAWVRFFGWRGAIPALIAVGALALAAISRRKGWEARERSGAENVKRVVEAAERARRESDRRNADPEQLRKDDGYRRD